MTLSDGPIATYQSSTQLPKAFTCSSVYTSSLRKATACYRGSVPSEQNLLSKPLQRSELTNPGVSFVVYFQRLQHSVVVFGGRLPHEPAGASLLCGWPWLGWHHWAWFPLGRIIAPQGAAEGLGELFRGRLTAVRTTEVVKNQFISAFADLETSYTCGICNALNRSLLRSMRISRSAS